MKRAFIDTNILIDLIADRKPFSKYAIAIFQRAEQKEIELFTSSHAIATTHYVLKKYIDDKKLREVLLNLMDYISIIAINADILKKGFRSNHNDFEDAIQILCASSVDKVDCIVTRNIKDFKKSEIKVLSPDEFVLVM
jgi:predicted nucleic acid-binding protein